MRRKLSFEEVQAAQVGKEAARRLKHAGRAVIFVVTRKGTMTSASRMNRIVADGTLVRREKALARAPIMLERLKGFGVDARFVGLLANGRFHTGRT